jgi:hypothetical protein
MAKANLENEAFFLDLIREGKLKITRDGRAFNLVTGREIAKEKPGVSANAYRKLSWQHPLSKRIVQVQLHRIVWARFRGIPDDPELIVNHRNGNTQNCGLSNLELTDDTGNNRHARDTGLVDIWLSQAENNSQSAFSNAQVRALRRKFAKRVIDVDYILGTYRVSRTTATWMLRGRTYSAIVTGYEKTCADILKSNPFNHR